LINVQYPKNWYASAKESRWFGSNTDCLVKRE
jgi:hypothetical protein